MSDVLARAAAENRKPSVQDFGDLVDNSDFLNALQKGVGRWIREMQKVRSHRARVGARVTGSASAGRPLAH